MFKKLFALLFLFLLKTTLSHAQDVYLNKNDSLHQKKRIIALPFSFYLESLGTTAAVNVATRGYIQDQISSTMVGLISTNGSRYLYLDISNVKIPWLNRVFVCPNANLAHYGNLDVFYGPNKNYPYEVAGSNSSHRDNRYIITSNKYEGELLFRYVLPIGYGRDIAMNTVVLQKGIPESGMIFNGNWVPFLSGRSFVESSIFYQNQTMTFPFGEKKLRTAGYTIGVVNENVDFVANPTVGTLLKGKYWIGTNALSSTVPWQMIEGSASGYYPIKGGFFRQQVVSLNIWTRYITSWDDYRMNNGRNEYYRPSPFMGANLGGRNRLRGFSESRFSDRSVLLYTAEYRAIPYWNPLYDLAILNSFGVKIDWIQLVAFAEVGRVSPTYSLATLHSKMRHDVGVGIRFLANQMVLRIDGAYSNEGAQVQMYLGQAF